MPAKRELSTVEAAHDLNVSRPFVIEEIEAGRLEHRMVGAHRRVPFEVLQACERAMNSGRAAALERLADNAREPGLDC